MRISKRNVTLVGILIVIMLSLTILAVEASDINYCENCGAHLETAGEYIRSWSTKHYFCDAQLNTLECKVDHNEYKTYHYCPKGHGTKKVEFKEYVRHNNSLCPQQ